MCQSSVSATHKDSRRNRRKMRGRRYAPKATAWQSPYPLNRQPTMSLDAYEVAVTAVSRQAEANILWSHPASPPAMTRPDHHNHPKSPNKSPPSTKRQWRYVASPHSNVNDSWAGQMTGQPDNQTPTDTNNAATASPHPSQHGSHNNYSTSTNETHHTLRMSTLRTNRNPLHPPVNPTNLPKSESSRLNRRNNGDPPRKERVTGRAATQNTIVEQTS